MSAVFNAPRRPLDWLPYVWNTALFPGTSAQPGKMGWAGLMVLLLLPAAMLYPSRGFHLLEPDEGRYAQIPKEMLARGEWVVPTLQGEPYLDKPPLMYWLVAASYRTFGVSPESARLVPAICVHLTILSVYLLGRRSIGDRAAFWAGLMLSAAPGFVGVARLLVLDGLLVLCVTLSVTCGFEAVRTGKLNLGCWVCSAVASGLGFLTKGPIAEILLFAPLWAFAFLMRGSNHQPARVGLKHYALFFAIVLAVNLPWYAAMYRREPAFLKHFFWEHNILRFLQPFDHLQPIWYYGPILIGGLMPGAVLLAAYLIRLVRDRPEAAAERSASSGFWLLAGGWCVVFFSLSGSKLPTYILPALPFLCLALGEFIARAHPGASWSVRSPLVVRTMVAASAIAILFAHHVLVPWYARERSPMGRPELVERFVRDPHAFVLCHPRNCDSLAFYSGRDDFRSIPTRQVNELMVDCHSRPRTVIFFTHRESLAGFRNILPPSLHIAETVSLARKPGKGFMDKLFGSTPWGLCDVAVIEPSGKPPRIEEGMALLPIE